MWFLESGNERKHYDNPKNSVEFLKKYGGENVYERLSVDIFDHRLAFKDNKGKVYVVSHPYYGVGNDAFDKNRFLLKATENKKMLGDLSHLHLEIYNPEENFYNPGYTYMIVFSYEE